MRTVHLICKGRVQGVFFRAETKKTADSLNIKGWVRNLANGDVEIEATGEFESISRLIDWCESGPPLASVSDLEVQELDLVPFEGFEVRRNY